MLDLNWSIFLEKFSGKEQKAFESLSYELFCLEHDRPFGIHSYQNQTGIESDPIKINKEYIGFQAKFLDVNPSDRKAELIAAFKKAKQKNEELSLVFFYLNKPFTESSTPNRKKSQKQIEIEKEAEELKIKLVWKVPSQLKIQLSQPQNERIYNRYFTRVNLPPSVEILQKFDSSSFHLKKVVSHFEGLEDSHIPRKETKQLIDWVSNPLRDSEKGIMLLVGNAGYGKSVIIKDLYEDLKRNNVPVLGIKADKYYTNNKKELQQQLDFDFPIETLIETISVTRERVVVLIDQIDALSQSMSAKREYLDSFQTLINSMSSIAGLRIIISVRTYDLHYDSDLQYYQNQRHIKVNKLEIDDVSRVLEQKGIKKERINDKLLDLIRVPHHLNVLCKISEGNENLHGIQTLHQLYNELWYQKITQYTHGSSCKEAIYEIASKMHTSQNINLSKFKIDEQYFSVIEYLKSNSLLVETKNEIQFFHQTFFDYCFAKQFVEKGQSVEEYILSNHQGLYVRSSLKMVMSFLRDHDPSSYIKSLEIIINDSKFRFHIKVLLISELGYREEPNELEVDFINRKIISSNIWEEIFIESINTSSWLYHFDKKGVLKRLISEKQSNNKLIELARKKFLKPTKSNLVKLNQVFDLLRRLLPSNRNQILQIVENFPEFKDKSKFVFKLLYFLKNWDDQRAIHLFEEYSKEEIPKDTHGYYKILEDASKDNLSWALDVYGKHLDDKIKSKENPYDKPNLEHSDLGLFEKFFNLDFEKTFDFTLDFVKKIVERIPSNSHLRNSELYSDVTLMFFAYGDARSTLNYYESVYHLLIDQAKKLSTNNSTKYRQFVEGHMNNNSLSILLILTISLQELPHKYIDLIFKFLTVFSTKSGFGIDSKFEYSVKELIRLSYPHFNKNQAKSINELILRIDPEIEKRIRVDQEGKNYQNLKWHGKTKYEYLHSIPGDLRDKQPQLKKVFQELRRKFGEPQIEKPRSTISRAVPPPLPITAYEKMNLLEWKNSFLRYDSEPFYGYGPLKGSKMEHSRSFRKQVSDRPSEFAPFVEKLIDENKVDHDYILSGLNGLKEGKYDPDDFKKLFKKALGLNLDREHTLYLVWLTDYFIDSKKCNDKIINFLCNMAISHNDPITNEEVEDPIQHGINTVRGAAADRLPYLLSYPDHVDLIFDTIEKILEDFSTSVKATLIPRLYYLMNLDKERTLTIFLKVVALDEKELLKYTPRTAQNLADHFYEELKPYFKVALRWPEIHGDVAVILAVLWVNNLQNSYRLLNKFLKKSEVARSRMVDVTSHYLLNDDPKISKKAEKIFLRFLNSREEKIIQEYSTMFLQFKDKPKAFFKNLFPLLLKYSKSNVVKSSPHYYYEYLLTNAKNYPKECIDLISRFKFYDKPDISKAGYYDDEPVKILLGAYNSLRSVESEEIYKEKSMKIFDEMLRDDRFRLSANKVTLHADS